MGSWSDTSSDHKAKIKRRPSSKYNVRFRHGVYPNAEGEATRADIKKYDYFFSNRQPWIPMQGNVDFVDETAQVITDLGLTEHNTTNESKQQPSSRPVRTGTVQSIPRVVSHDSLPAGIRPPHQSDIGARFAPVRLSKASTYPSLFAAEHHQYNSSAPSPMSSLDGNSSLDWQHDAPALFRTSHSLKPSRLPLSLSSSEEAQLFRFWVDVVSPWWDITSSHNIFKEVVPQLASQNSILLNAMLMCASQHIQKVHASFPAKPYLYHRRVSQQLIPYLAEHGRIQDEGTLVAAMFLRAFEEHHAGSSGQNHLSTYELFHGPDGWLCNMSSPVVQACFMVHVHFEIFQGLLNPSNLRVDYQSYIVPALISPSDNASWSNKITWQCARILQWASLNSRSLSEWQELRDLVDEWERERPIGFNAFFYREADPAEGHPYPELWFPNPCHVDAHQHLLICRIALALSYPRFGRPQTIEVEDTVVSEITKLLKEMVVVARSNPHAVSASWKAAHAMHQFALSIRDPLEQSNIMEFLEEVEAIGWPTTLARRRLRVKWGWSMQENVQHNDGGSL